MQHSQTTLYALLLHECTEPHRNVNICLIFKDKSHQQIQSSVHNIIALCHKGCMTFFCQQEFACSVSLLMHVNRLMEMCR